MHLLPVSLGFDNQRGTCVFIIAKSRRFLNGKAAKEMENFPIVSYIFLYIMLNGQKRRKNGKNCNNMEREKSKHTVLYQNMQKKGEGCRRALKKHKTFSGEKILCLFFCMDQSLK